MAQKLIYHYFVERNNGKMRHCLGVKSTLVPIFVTFLCVVEWMAIIHSPFHPKCKQHHDKCLNNHDKVPSAISNKRLSSTLLNWWSNPNHIVSPTRISTNEETLWVHKQIGKQSSREHYQNTNVWCVVKTIGKRLTWFIHLLRFTNLGDCTKTYRPAISLPGKNIPCPLLSAATSSSLKSS